MTLARTTEPILPSEKRAEPRRAFKTRAVTFVVPPGIARHAQLVGEFTSWTPLAMDRGADGGHRVTVSLQVGRSWMYQFVLDDERRVNDMDAAFFVPGPNCGHVSALHV